MATWILVNIGSGNGLLPDGTKPLPEPLLTDHQWSPVTFILGQFHKRCLNCQWQKIRLKITYLKFYSNFPGTNVIRHWEVIKSHGIFWDIITYPCSRYMYLVVASPHQYTTLWVINSNDILLNSGLKYIKDGIITITIINDVTVAWRWQLMSRCIFISGFSSIGLESISCWLMTWEWQQPVWHMMTSPNFIKHLLRCWPFVQGIHWSPELWCFLRSAPE